MIQQSAINKESLLFESQYVEKLNISASAARFEMEACAIWQEIEKLKIRHEAAVIAACKCKKDSIISTITAQDATEIINDYIDNGFSGKKVKIFIQKLAEKFFSTRHDDYNYELAEWATNLLCKKISRFKYENEKIFHDRYLEVAFEDAISKKYFEIHIPIKENIFFNEDNFQDNTLGKYLFFAIVPLNLDLSVLSQHQVITTLISNKTKEIALIDASFNGSNLIPSIKMYLTSDAVDKKRYQNHEIFYQYPKCNISASSFVI